MALELISLEEATQLGIGESSMIMSKSPLNESEILQKQETSNLKNSQKKRMKDSESTTTELLNQQQKKYTNEKELNLQNLPFDPAEAAVSSLESNSQKR